MTSTPLLDVANSDGSSETSGNSFTSIESPLNHNGWSRLRERLRSANENEMERPGSASCAPAAGAARALGHAWVAGGVRVTLFALPEEWLGGRPQPASGVYVTGT